MNQTISEIVVVAGGRVGESFKNIIQKAEYTIGIDAGAFWLVSHTIRCDLALGDFDSTSYNNKLNVQQLCGRFLEFPPEKDKTDFELGIDEILKISPNSVRIYGATGTRLDQTFSAVSQLERLLNRGIDVRIIDENNVVFLVQGMREIESDPKYRYVSVLSYSDLCVITLNNFRYDLHQKTIRKTDSIGISNEFFETPGIITVHEGIALVVLSKD